MKIVVSGETLEITDSITVAELLELAQVEMPEYVTVSINEEFVRRADFSTRRFQPGDVVEFLYYMGGGRA